jgi:hypothetical protein
MSWRVDFVYFVKSSCKTLFTTESFLYKFEEFCMNIENGFNIKFWILLEQTNDWEQEMNEKIKLTLSAVPLTRSIASVPICRMWSSTILFNSTVAFGTRLTNLNRRAKSIKQMTMYHSKYLFKSFNFFFYLPWCFSSCRSAFASA